MIDAHIHAGTKVGANELQIHLRDHGGAPIKDATVTLAVNMATMDMGVKRPPVTNHKDGTYTATVVFSMAGAWKVDVTAKSPTAGEAAKSFEFRTGAGMQMDEQEGVGAMRGRLNNWGMQKEGSGTSLLPESSPMYMKHLGNRGGFDLSAMGFITYNFSDAGGTRGESRFYSNSMLMLMGSKDEGRQTKGFSVMLSLDPVFNGRFGYPNLFQTGETAYGVPLTDFQHPHDLFVEVALTHSYEIGNGLRVFAYGGPVAEPALGGPTFMHRPSGVEIPEAPIGHHWFDSTHIAWGVVTLGANTDRWQVEGSLFNGHEPDENRYSPDNVALNSASARFTLTPSRDTAFNASYGFLDEPEATEPGVSQHRLTASAIWNRALAGGANLAMTAAFGRNYKEGDKTDAFLLEGTFSRGDTTYFARWESVDKDELGGVPAGTYKVGKFLVGGIKEVRKFQGLDLGVGAYAGFYVFPSALEPFYGKSPLTLGVFVRLRPGRMEAGAHAGH
jgi:hypothetical protein